MTLTLTAPTMVSTLCAYYNKIVSHSEFSSYRDSIYYSSDDDLNLFIIPEEEMTDEQLEKLFALVSNDLERDYNEEKSIPFLNILTAPKEWITQFGYKTFSEQMIRKRQCHNFGL